MSNLYSSKPTRKPLKGSTITSSIGAFDTITANTIVLESVDVGSLVVAGELDGVTMKNSTIINTVIGSGGANEAIVTKLTALSNVYFQNVLGTEFVSWNPDTSEFYISSTLQVEGCSQFGNIKICENDIYAVNTNGDVNIIPNGIGSVYIKGPFYHTSTFGNFYSEVKAGSAIFNISENVIFRATGSSSITSFDSQNYTTRNGDITLGVDTAVSNLNISQIRATAGNINVTTTTNHNLKVGDVVTLSGVGNGISPSLIGNFTVGSIIANNSFRLSTTTSSVATVTGGSVIKTYSNNILLNTNSYVKIPTDSKITFGVTTNAVSGNTSGLNIQSIGDIHYILPSSNNIYIPDISKTYYGTSGNYIGNSGGNLYISGSAGTKLTIEQTNLEIKSTNVTVADPILKLANYTTDSSDNKDRGIEFNYFDTTTNTQKLGWFGYKKSTGRFTFITSATNNNEIITGDIGNLELSQLALTNITLADGGSINANCGLITGVSNLRGCNGTINISGTENVNVISSNRIYLNSSVDVLIPNSTKLLFSTSGSLIKETTGGNLAITSYKNIEYTTQTGGSISIPINTSLTFTGTSVGSQRIYSNTSGQLNIESNKDILLTTTGGNVKLPSNTEIHLGSSSQNISGNTSGIRILSNSTNSGFLLISNSDVNVISSSGNILLASYNGDVKLYPSSGNVRIPETINLAFGITGTTNSISSNTNGNLVIYGKSSGNLEVSNVKNINLSANEVINIPTNTKLNIGNANTYLYSDSLNNTYFKNENTNGSFTINSPTTNITSGSINITSSTFIINGTTGSISKIMTENTTIKDPVVTISDYSTFDSKDRGIEYRYLESITSGSKLGWFGKKTSTGRFTFYSDATNTNEVITGTLGDLEVANAWVKSSINFTSIGNINLSCGDIINVKNIVGCTGVVNISGTTAINFIASEKIQVPRNVPLSFGDTSNSIKVDNYDKLIVSSSELEIYNNRTAIYSTNVYMNDPIVTVGGVTSLSSNDNKDRGLEFRWHNGTTSKLGFFGYKSNIGRFVFIKDGTNTNEIFTGDYADVQFGNIYSNNINLNNGSLTGLSELSGGSINIKTTSGNLNINPTSGSSVILSYNTKFAFGNTSNSISSDTAGNLEVISSTINLNATEYVKVPEEIPMYFGDSSIKYTNGNMIVSNSVGNINLVPSTTDGKINIPINNYLTFDSTSNSIYSDGAQLYISGYSGVGIASSSITISGDINIIGTLSAGQTDFDLNKYILPLGTYQILYINEISNYATTTGKVLITSTLTHNLVSGDKVEIKNTNSVPIIDGIYTVQNIISSKSFTINYAEPLTQNGDTGSVKSNLTTEQGKDVGIQVNYWSTTGSTSVTAGTAAYKTGFFGFKRNNERWAFYENATIENNIVTGNLGDIEVDKVYANKMSGYILEGSISAGNNYIAGNNFNISGGSINGTPIGVYGGSTGRFTSLTNTVQAQLSDVTLLSGFKYSFERYTLTSTGTPGTFVNNSPSMNVVTSIFSVIGPSYTTSSGTMPSLNISDGTLKILVCSSMDDGCAHTIYFGPGKLISPNHPTNINSQPTKLVFKRRGQSVQLMHDRGSWIILHSGCYVE